VFIPETDRPGVIEYLARVLSQEPEPVTAEERAAAAARFDWETVARGFWDGCLD
jgi:hypothetical protein